MTVEYLITGVPQAGPWDEPGVMRFGTAATRMIRESGCPHHTEVPGGYTVTPRWVEVLYHHAPIGAELVVLRRALADEEWRAAAVSALALSGDPDGALYALCAATIPWWDGLDDDVRVSLC